jgi:polysaccharide pyruvyl transferase WcaK-like protein
MKIGLLGQFGAGNSGNDGSLEAMATFLRRARPDAELVCICSKPDVVEAAFGMKAVPVGVPPPRSRFYAAVNALMRDVPRKVHNVLVSFASTRDLDLLLVPGTGILDDFREAAFGWPFVLLRWCIAASMSGTRIAFVNIGAGPIENRLSRRFMKMAANLAGYRSYRDEVSRRFMRELGCDVTEDTVRPDLAFALPAPEATAPARPGTTVAIGVMSYFGWRKDADEDGDVHRTYLGKVERLVTWVLSQGYHVRLLTGDAEDRKTATALLDRLDRALPADMTARLVAEPCETLHLLMRQIAQSDIVVATRYHNVICALKMARPTISIGYARKNEALLSDVGLAEYCHHVERFDVDTVIEQFRRIFRERQEVSDAIARRVETYRQQLVDQEATLLEWMRGASHVRSRTRAVEPQTAPDASMSLPANRRTR